MKSDKTQSGSVITPVLQDLVDRAKQENTLRNPSMESTPLKPAALYEDAGDGYNSNFTFPQD
ncbi:MAG: hypothetical protein M3Y57_07045 [Acidobacteriota bacterium]|nr:hypothetical protein [Acidobacteriota bacterium]